MYWIVTLGGGTGTYTVLKGLKRQRMWQDISAIIAVTDDGGGNGKHRDEFGFLPVSDFRKAIVALADDRESQILRDLFMYRFDKGEGLSGHTFGNLLLIAMTDILGSEELAIEYASHILRANGNVLPVSHDQIHLVSEYEDGQVVKGETLIDECNHDGTKHITNLWVEPQTTIAERSKRAIEKADVIVLGPGDLYTSTLACVVVPGVAEAIKNSSAKLVYVSNLMTKCGQTYGFTQQKFIDEITKYVGRAPDNILINTTPLPSDILEQYEKENDFPVVDDLGDGDHIVRTDLLANESVTIASGDTLKRSLIRHDSDKIAMALSSLV